MPSPERLLVSAILLHGRRSLLSKLNFAPEDMVKHKDELFYLCNLKAVPSKKVFLAKFPDFNVSKVPSNDTEALIMQCKERRIRKDAVEAVRKTTTDIQNDEPMDKTIYSLEKAVRAITGRFDNTVDVNVLKGSTFIDSYAERRAAIKAGRTLGVPYGSPTMDRLTGGMLPGEMIAVAARTSVGKSWVMCHWAAASILAGFKTQYFSVEMSPDEISARVFTLCSYMIQASQGDGEIKPSKLLLNQDLQLGKISIRKVHKIIDEIRKHVKAELHVPDIKGRFSIKAAGRQIERLEPQAAFFDYFGLGIGETGKVENWQAAGEASHDAKQIARTYALPFVIGAQLNRAGAQAPSIENIALSDSVGQDSDKIYLLEKRGPGRLQLKCGKFRGGPDGWRIVYKWNVNSGQIVERKYVADEDDEDEDE